MAKRRRIIAKNAVIDLSGGQVLPFLKKKDQGVGVIIQKTRMPDEAPEEANDDSAAIEACASELIRAIHARDPKAVAMAIKDLMEVSDQDVDSVEPHSYDAQNMKAGEEA